jgi:hypothetical protein
MADVFIIHITEKVHAPQPVKTFLHLYGNRIITRGSQMNVVYILLASLKKD